MIRAGNFFFHYRNALFPLAFLLMLWGGTWPIFPSERARFWGMLAGVLMAFAGQGLRAITVGLAYIKRGGKNKQVYADRLVQEGIFAHSRNPLYVGNLMIAAGVGFLSNSMPFLLLGFPFLVFAYFAIVCAEEDYLRSKFGQEFENYCARVGRFVPNLSGIGSTLRNSEFHWRRLVVKEYQTPFLWMAGTIFLMIKAEYLRAGHGAGQQTLWTLSIALLLLTSAFLTAWYLKKSKLLRAD